MVYLYIISIRYGFQVMLEQLKKAATQHSLLKEQLARSRDDNDDLRFQVHNFIHILYGT